jgi:hypothetical protein
MATDKNLLANIPNGNGEVQIRISEYKGKTYVDIRKFYRDEYDEMKPTPKGISMSPALARKVIDALIGISKEDLLPKIEAEDEEKK